MKPQSLGWLNCIAPMSLLFLFSLSVIDAIATLMGIVSDPGQIPRFLAYISIGGAGILLLVTLWKYLTQRVPEDWRVGLLRFGMLYFCLLTGFASAYYLLKKDFAISIDDDHKLEAACKVFEKEIAAYQANIKEISAKIPPAELKEAKAAYDELESLERETEVLTDAIAQKSQRIKPGDTNNLQDIVEMQAWGNRLEETYKEEPELKRILSKYPQYQDQLKSLSSAEKSLSETRSRETVEKGKYSYFNFVYFSTVTMATVGYGDIAPKTRSARMLVTLEILLGGVLVLVYLTLVLGNRGEKSARH